VEVEVGVMEDMFVCLGKIVCLEGAVVEGSPLKDAKNCSGSHFQKLLPVVLATSNKEAATVTLNLKMEGKHE
jgi:hypothetical protein